MTKSVRYRNTDLTEVSDICFSILSFFIFVFDNELSFEAYNERISRLIHEWVDRDHSSS